MITVFRPAFLSLVYFHFFFGSFGVEKCNSQYTHCQCIAIPSTLLTQSLTRSFPTSISSSPCLIQNLKANSIQKKCRCSVMINEKYYIRRGVELSAATRRSGLSHFKVIQVVHALLLRKSPTGHSSIVSSVTRFHSTGILQGNTLQARLRAK